MPIGSEGVIGRLPGQSFTDGFFRVPRFGRYGENSVNNFFQGMNAVADEGSYFVTHSIAGAALGTGVSFGGAAITSFTDTTSAGLIIQNTDVAGGKRVYLDYIKLSLRTIATGSLVAPFQFFIDQVDNLSTRWSSGGSALTPNSSNMDTSNSSISSIHYGAVILNTASASVRKLGWFQLRGNLVQVIQDDIFLQFGSVEKNYGGPAVVATVSRFQVPRPAVVLGPGQCYTLHQYCAGQTAAPLYDLEMGHIER